MRLYVGNLSYTTTEDTLREAFSNYGEVVSVQIMKDKFTEQSKGFGFVEMGTEIMSERAIGGMNGKSVDGRRIRVSVAVEKKRSEDGAKRFFKDDGEKRKFSDRGERREHGAGRERGDRRERGGRDKFSPRGPKSERPQRQAREERTSADEY